MTITATTLLPTQFGNIQVNYHAHGDETCLSLVFGNSSGPMPLLCRLHSACIFGESFGSLLCDCKPQLDAALIQISKEGRGIVVYLFQEGRGIGLEEKIREHELQRTKHMNTVEAMAHLGYEPDPRRYDIAISALHELGCARQLRLISNNPRKRQQLEGGGFEVVEKVPLCYAVNDRTLQELTLKADWLQHDIDFSKLTRRNNAVVTLAQRIDQVRFLSEHTLNESTDLITVSEEALSKMIPRLKSELQKRKASPLIEDEMLAPQQQLGLKLFFGVINYCFTHPFTREAYTYQQGDRVCQRSTGFRTALVSAGLDWSDFATVEQLSTSRWHAILQTDQDAQLYDIHGRLFRLRRFAKFMLGRGIRSSEDFSADCETAQQCFSLLWESGLFDDDFLKRAQITLLHVSQWRERHLKRSFPDIGALSVMADYRLPQLLYNWRILGISDASLLEKLTQAVPIDANSREERALRAGAVVIGNRLAHELQISEAQVDQLLWSLSQTLLEGNKMPIFHMRVATDAY